MSRTVESRFRSTRMHTLLRVAAMALALTSASVSAENWVEFKDTDGEFWDANARHEVDLDSVRPAVVADAKDPAGKTLAGPFVVATRRAVLSDSARATMKVDVEITAEYYDCTGTEILRSENGAVLSVEMTAGKKRIKYEGKPGDTYVLGPALTGWMTNLQAAVCAHAGKAGKS